MFAPKPNDDGAYLDPARLAGGRSETVKKEGPTEAMVFSYPQTLRRSRYLGPEYRPSQHALAQHVREFIVSPNTLTRFERRTRWPTGGDKTVVSVWPL